MSHPVQLSDQLFDDARRYASVSHRSVPKQIEYWARIGKMADDNPDLPYSFIKEILLSKQEADDGNLMEYQFG
jgi:ParD-like antitoxin of type II bacterial toxin-antitoxin system